MPFLHDIKPILHIPLRKDPSICAVISDNSVGKRFAPEESQSAYRAHSDGVLGTRLTVMDF
jgi:hypothetical protein